MSSQGQKLAAELLGYTLAMELVVAPLDFRRDHCLVCDAARVDHTPEIRGTMSTILTCPPDSKGNPRTTNFIPTPETLEVGVAEVSADLVRRLERHTGYQIQTKIMSVRDIRENIAKNFTPPAPTNDKSEVEKIVDDVLTAAARQRASNIFFEFSVDGNGKPIGRIRLDVLGDIRQYRTIDDLGVYKKLTSYLLRESLDGDQTNMQVGQRGKLIRDADGHTLNLRFSSFPIYHPTEDGLIKIVLRALRSAEFLPTPTSAGLLPEQIEILTQALEDKHCTMLIGGPPGSGKSTTYYMLLSLLPLTERNIYSIEDPPEIFDPRITQTAVKPSQDWTVEEALREILRQRPDLVFLGELLDPRVAQLFIAANIRSVPIGSTIHAENALVIVAALQNFEISPVAVSQGLTMLCAQRLVQHLCPSCRVPVSPSERLIAFARDHAALIDDDTIVYERGHGCPDCDHTGITGRSAIFEVVPVDDKMRAAIVKQDAPALAGAAREQGYITMAEHALPRILRGEIAASSIGLFPESLAHNTAIPASQTAYHNRLRSAVRSAPRRASAEQKNVA